MAFTLAELIVKIRADDTRIQGALPTLQSKLRRVQVSMEKVSRIARRMFLVVGGVMGLTVKFASDAEESHSKFLAVFKEEADAAKAWGDAHANAVGRARLDMEKYLASMQDTFVPLGFARRESRKLSQQLVQLGIDLASFNNIADDKVLRDLQSALVGNHEAIRRYGIIITETALKQELLNMGITKNFQAVTIQEKVQGRLNIIMRSSTDAQGDAIRTAGSFANQLKRLQGNLKDLAAETGRAFIPSLLSVINLMQSAIKPISAWIIRNQRLVASIGMITLGVLALLAILPLLLSSLSILAAHPVLAAVIALGAAAAATAVHLRAMKQAAVEAFAFDRPMETAKDLQDGIDALYRLKQATEKELAALPEEYRPLHVALGPRGVLIEDITTYTMAIKELALRLKIVQAAEKATAKARKEAAEATKEITEQIETKEQQRAAKKAEETWITTFTKIERSRLTAQKRALELLEDEIRAMAKAAREAGVYEEQKFNIVKFWDEQKARIKKKFADEEARERERALADIKRKAELAETEAKKRARERLGAGRVAPAATGIIEFAKRIRAAIFRSREQAEQKRLMMEAIKVERAQLAVQTETRDAVRTLAPGLVSVP